MPEMKRRKEPEAELIRFRHLLAWLPYSRHELRKLIENDVIRPEPPARPGARLWFRKSQVKAALNL